MVSQIDLSDFFVTKAQANEFIHSLDNIIDQMYELHFDLEQTLSKEFGIEKKDKFLEMLRETKMNMATNEVLKELFQNLQMTVRKLPILSLTLAFEPDEATLKSLLQWCLFTLNRQILIDITVDKTLIAGAMVNFNGRFKNYSVKPQLDEVINKALFPAPKVEEKNKPHQSTQSMNIGR